MSAMIQDLRKENQALKQANYEYELKVKGTTFTEDKVNLFLSKVKVLNEEIDRLSVLV